MEGQIKSLDGLIQALKQLPGIGARSAQKLAMAVVHMPKVKVQNLADSLMKVKDRVHLCESCFNLAEDRLCEVCKSEKRDKQVICVVEQPLDLWNLEKARVFRGLYHVLHGHLNPLDGIGPEDLFIPQLFDRLADEAEIREVILATNPTVEGETTAMFLEKEIKRLRPDIKVTRLARGLSVGSGIEYVDPMTLKSAFENRS
ncbi:MAG: recombination protein RecR [bacterium]|nr:recombination protein RecR [bacterium]